MFGWGKKQPLVGVRIAVLAADGVDHTEISSSWKALQKAGAELFLVSLKRGKIRAVKSSTAAKQIPVDATLNEVHPASFAALLLPGGLSSADRLREDDKALQFVRSFTRTNRPIGAISRAPWLLASAGAITGRTLTSAPAIQSDLRNAGAEWQDEAVVVDGNLLTSRGHKDLKKFNKRLIAHISEQINPEDV